MGGTDSKSVFFLLVPVDSKNRRLEQWEKDKYGRKARIVAAGLYTLGIILKLNAMHGTADTIGTALVVSGGCVIAGFIKNQVEKL